MMTQFPVDGKPGKGWKITSPFGWRTHPTSGQRSHHNGVDIWTGGNVYNEAFHLGKVIFAGPSKTRKADGSVGGFGHHVMLKHWIDGEVYISVYAHMVEGSIAVKVGDSVRAGVPLGKMGATGDVTGKHLHFEIYKGKRYTWSATGKNFVDPIAFIKALQVKQDLLKSAPLATPDDSVSPATKVAVKSAPVKKVVK